LLVPAVITYARNFQVLAIAKISAPARETCVVLAAVPANADALPPFARRNTRTYFIYDARDLMAWDAGVLNPWPRAFFRERVTVANTTGLHLDADLSGTRIRNLALDDLEIASRASNLCRLHRCYPDFCSCHIASHEFLNIVLSISDTFLA
jgi:hypothetical protein